MIANIVRLCNKLKYLRRGVCELAANFVLIDGARLANVQQQRDGRGRNAPGEQLGGKGDVGGRQNLQLLRTTSMRWFMMIVYVARDSEINAFHKCLQDVPG